MAEYLHKFITPKEKTSQLVRGRWGFDDTQKCRFCRILFLFQFGVSRGSLLLETSYEERNLLINSIFKQLNVLLQINTVSKYFKINTENTKVE